jgi:hypothetical protein
MGHADPGVTIRVYAHIMRRSTAEREALRTLVGGVHWDSLGRERDSAPAAGGIPVGIG